MARFQLKKKYAKISFVKRVKLIELVEEQGLGVSKAARQLRMKIPTAKVILSNYRKKDHIYVKKSDKTVPKEPAETAAPAVKAELIEPTAEQLPPLVVQFQPSMPFYPIVYWATVLDSRGMIIF